MMWTVPRHYLGQLRAGLVLATVALLLTADTATRPWSTLSYAVHIENSDGCPAVLLLPVTNATGMHAAWIRLGLMDLITNRLRAAGQPMLPTDAAIALLHGLKDQAFDPSNPGIPRSLAQTFFEADVGLRDRVWRVSIRGSGAKPSRIQAVGEDIDVLTAARTAADRLAVALKRECTLVRDEHALVPPRSA